MACQLRNRIIESDRILLERLSTADDFVTSKEEDITEYDDGESIKEEVFVDNNMYVEDSNNEDTQKDNHSLFACSEEDKLGRVKQDNEVIIIDECDVKKILNPKEEVREKEASPRGLDKTVFEIIDLDDDSDDSTKKETDGSQIFDLIADFNKEYSKRIAMKRVANKTSTTNTNRINKTTATNRINRTNSVNKINRTNTTNKMNRTNTTNKTNKVLSCTYCNDEFNSTKEMQCHMSKHKLTKCSICNASIRSDNFKRHFELHTAPKEICEICGKTAKNKESLRGHMFYQHRDNGELYKCQFCPKVFRYRYKHKMHVRKAHTGKLLQFFSIQNVCLYIRLT